MNAGPMRFARPAPPEKESRRTTVLVRVAAILIALLIAWAAVWAYAMTATIIGSFLATPSLKPGQEKGVVSVKVLPASEQPPPKPSPQKAPPH